MLKYIKRYFRFRDDVNLRIKASTEITSKILKIVMCGYPTSIDFNVKVTFLRNTFLNLRFYILPTKNNLSISILRKKHDKHDIVRKTSCSNPNYVGAALRTSSFNMIKYTNNHMDMKHQFKVYNEILNQRGYSTDDFKKAIIKMKKPKKATLLNRKIYSGKITYDKLTNIHTLYNLYIGISGYFVMIIQM